MARGIPVPRVLLASPCPSGLDLFANTQDDLKPLELHYLGDKAQSPKGVVTVEATSEIARGGQQLCASPVAVPVCGVPSVVACWGGGSPCSQPEAACLELCASPVPSRGVFWWVSVLQSYLEGC